LGLSRGIELEGDAIGGAAAQQTGFRDAAGIGSVEFRDNRALWIGCDRCDRAGARPEAESMQGTCRAAGVKGHDIRPLSNAARSSYRPS
jgi:hypothetical protein